MNRLMVPANCCYVGDVLAEDVLTDKGITLVAQNTVLTGYIKEKFMELRVPCVWLYEPPQLLSGLEYDTKFKKKKETYKDAILNLKSVLKDIADGDKVDYESVIDISKDIDSSISESSHIIKCLSEIKSADEYTYTHCINVALYSMLIAKWLRLPEDSVNKVIQAGLLHDIGKVKIPDKILNKKSRLTVEEFEIMKKHSVYGYNLIKDISNLSEGVKTAVLLHHERMDGSGYPFGYTQNSISLLARIISIADVYDAMTQNRVYKNKANPFASFEMFLTVGANLFDTTILSVFMKNMAAFYVGTKVLLSNGESGDIVYIPPDNILSPIINVGSDIKELSRDGSLKVLNLL